MINQIKHHYTLQNTVAYTDTTKKGRKFHKKTKLNSTLKQGGESLRDSVLIFVVFEVWSSAQINNNHQGIYYKKKKSQSTQQKSEQHNPHQREGKNIDTVLFQSGAHVTQGDQNLSYLDCEPLHQLELPKRGYS